MARRNDESPIRIFQSDYLERFTLISVRVFLSVWLPITFMQATLAVYLSQSILSSVIAAICGFSFWFFFEYAMHRFLFHFKSKNKYIDKLVWIMHTNHHIQPSHKLRTIMPLSVSIPLGLIFEALGLSIFGKGVGSAALAGFFAGYVIYDITHYACHNFRMKSPIAMYIKKHHLRHHFANEEKNFAISLPFIDRIFSTRN